MQVASYVQRPCLSLPLHLLVLVSLAVACAGAVTLLLYDLGTAFNEPCTAPGAKNLGYSGCFNWTQWFESVAIILLSFFFFAASFLSVTALVHTASAPRAGCAQKACALAAHLILLVLMVGGAYASMKYLAKPWNTYQTDKTGITLPKANWTMDPWQVFLGSAVFAGCAPFAVALVAVLVNLCIFERSRTRIRRAINASGEFDEFVGGRSGSGVDDNELGEHLMPTEEQQGSSHSSPQQLHLRAAGLARYHGVPWGGVIASLLILALCLVITAVLPPLWNDSAFTYFMLRSMYPWGNSSIGGERPCSLGPAPTCGCEGFDVCPWFSFHFYTDAMMFYLFVGAAVFIGAVGHNVGWCLCGRRPTGGPNSVVGFRFLPEKMRFYRLGCSVFEAVLIVFTGSFMIFWFFYWCVRVRMRVFARARARMRENGSVGACACECVGGWVRMHKRACMRGLRVRSSACVRACVRASLAASLHQCCPDP
jgi:hypothetical protein